jgi:prepilin-type processing-associated H-X9-DG protein
MNYYPLYFTDGNPRNLAYITPDGASPGNGRYTKQVEWTHAAERGLIADAITHVITTPGTFGPTSPMMPFDYSSGPTIPAGTFYVDAKRHLAPAASKKDAFNSAGMNMLFCDGHAGTISVRDAWNSIHNPAAGDQTSP